MSRILVVVTIIAGLAVNATAQPSPVEWYPETIQLQKTDSGDQALNPPDPQPQTRIPICNYIEKYSASTVLVLEIIGPRLARVSPLWGEVAQVVKLAVTGAGGVCALLQ